MEQCQMRNLGARLAAVIQRHRSSSLNYSCHSKPRLSVTEAPLYWPTAVLSIHTFTVQDSLESVRTMAVMFANGPSYLRPWEFKFGASVAIAETYNAEERERYFFLASHI